MIYLLDELKHYRDQQKTPASVEAGVFVNKCLTMIRAALRYSPGETPKKQNPDQMAGVSQ
ncbi:MAG: hypothetical protein J7L56_08910 [Halomonas sp.]|nr:hypothetical protein [Halomonas sp.]MCD6438365.1 hypothetical protein [Halomonas sp.]